MLKQSKSIEFYFRSNYNDSFSYFQDGLKTIEHFGNYVADLSVKLQKIRQTQDEEKRELVGLRNLIKSMPNIEKEVFNSTIYSIISINLGVFYALD